MLRISATTIEEYRLVCQADWKTEEELIASVMGKPSKPTEAMTFGKEWQSIMEKDYGTITTDFVNGGPFTFRRQDIIKAKECIPEGAIPELKTVKRIQIDGYPVDLVCKVDAIHGSTIYENKAKLSQASIKSYEQSLQWKLYCLAFSCDLFIYNIFSFHIPAGTVAAELRQIHRFPFYRYDGIEQDCLSWIWGFVRWARANKLLSYLERS